jgi:hypothetical protein
MQPLDINMAEDNEMMIEDDAIALEDTEDTVS